MTNTKELKEIMELKGISKNELARQLGISTYLMEKKINGDMDFLSNEINSICEILEINNCKDRYRIFFNKYVEIMSTI